MAINMNTTAFDSLSLFHENNGIDGVEGYLYYWSVFVCTAVPFFYVWRGFYGEDRNNAPTQIVANNLPKQLSIVEQDEEYLNTARTKFLKIFDNKEKLEEYSVGIDSVFYKLSELAEVLQDDKNEIEKKWKTKIMMKTTPRGNIFMMYDAFKQGFSYYADQQFIPYNILNAMAMEYVRMFQCLDFFMDETELKGNYMSKLVTLQEIEDKEEKEKKLVKNKIHDIDLKGAPFIKPKPIAEPVNKQKPGIASAGNKPPPSNKKRNLFIYAGKIRDMKVWKVDKKIKANFTGKSELMPKINMGYAEYKKKMRELELQTK